jgi:hypothetical protein
MPKRKANNQGGQSPKRKKQVTFALPNNAPVMTSRRKLSSPPRRRATPPKHSLTAMRNALRRANELALQIALNSMTNVKLSPPKSKK